MKPTVKADQALPGPHLAPASYKGALYHHLTKITACAVVCKKYFPYLQSWYPRAPTLKTMATLCPDEKEKAQHSVKQPSMMTSSNFTDTKM